MNNKQIGFIGVGKLGKDAAEVMNEFYDVEGYDILPVNTTIKMVESIQECVTNKDIVFVAVPTPHHQDYDGRYPTSHLEPKDFDYSIARNVIQEADKHMNKNQLLVLISTVLPGTVRREIAPLITNARFIYNPYLIAQGTVKWDMKNPEMIMIGTQDGDETGDAKILKDFYQPIVHKEGRDGITRNADFQLVRFELGTWEEVESMKIFYNTFITAKLCLVNMIQDAAMKVGHMNAEVVANALKKSTMRIMGPNYMKPGLGDGGACHPRDNIALRSFAERHDFGYDLFDAIMIAREKQAENMAKYIHNNIPEKMKVVMLGSGFKRKVNQLAGSPVLLVGYYLEQLGRAVEYDVDENENDIEINIKETACYFLGQMNTYNSYIFNDDSVVFDTWRNYEKTNCKVIHYGNTR